MAITRKMFKQDRSDAWYGDFRQFGRGRESLGTAVRKDAELAYDKKFAAYHAAYMATLPPGTLEAGVPAVLTIDLLLQKFAESRAPYVDPRVTRDRDRYRQIITKSIHRNTALPEVDRALVEGFVTDLKDDHGDKNGDPFSESYQHKIILFLCAALAWAEACGYIAASPARHLDPIMLPGVEPEEETKFYWVPEGGAILSALRRNPDDSIPSYWPKGTPYYVFEQVAFALHTGARRNEVMAQRWEWVDWDKGVVKVMTSKRRRGRKRDRPAHSPFRVIPMWPQLREILLAYWHHMGDPAEGLLFPKRRESERRKHIARIERGGRADKSIRAILRARKIITGTKERPLFKGQPGYQFGWREFRVTYCAARLQCVEPVAGQKDAWVPVAQRTVELEMGHDSSDMVEAIYGRVQEGMQQQMRLTTLAYPLTRLQAGVLQLHTA